MIKGICVTGGRGFIGLRLVAELTRIGAQVRVLSRTPRSDDQNTTYYVGDLANAEGDLSGLLADIDVIFHCAGEVKEPALMRPLHVDGTARLLKAARHQIRLTGRPIHWVQLSSVGAYGPPAGAAHESRVVVETSPCSPVGEYEITKTLSDALIEECACIESLFSFSTLRPSNVIGPTMSNQSLRSLVSMIEKRFFFYIGSKQAVATYVHVDDVVAALVLCGSHADARGHIFNLSNDCLLANIVDAVARHNNLPSPTLCLPELPVRIAARLGSLVAHTPLTQERIDALVKRTCYPTTKIESRLGYVSKFFIPTSVASMF